ncbi:MAG: 3-methyl-2-oxobutanoate dehydrogenase subunit VorB [Tissierellia bacterium]|nr:3-methyl-2-oxobutanoate dehydrogenase subunit VorB [Tissierellia bacterium]
MAKVLMKGNEAVAEAAIKAGCRYFFGYPITPQSEVPEYFARELPKIGGCFLQAESEVASINMLYGAAGAGARVMTSSSSPGIALMQEGISYMAGANLPCVIVNMMRGGPGLGSIQPSQTDYFLSTRGGGNGDYRTPTYAPSSIQEMVDLTIKAFDIADKYRNPVFVIGDGMLGQMMEPVEFPEENVDPETLPKKEWAADGTKRDHRNIINSLFLSSDELEKFNKEREKKYEEIIKNEQMVETVDIEDCDIVLSAYGTTARICKTAKEELEKDGIKVGIIRPITLWPYPYDAFKDLKCKDILVVEMNLGQMTDDVKIAVEGRQKVHFYGRQGGEVPVSEEIVAKVKEILGR